jgi:hypothetical protein
MKATVVGSEQDVTQVAARPETPEPTTAIFMVGVEAINTKNLIPSGYIHSLNAELSGASGSRFLPA